MPAARGQHLFTHTKRHLMDWARAARDGGYVQRGHRRPPLQPARQHRAGRPRDRVPARLDPGLGRTTTRRAPAQRRRHSAALFYTKLNDGHERPVYAPGAPPRDRRPHPGPLRAARHARRSRRRTPSWRRGPSCTSRSTPTTTWRCSPSDRARRRPGGGDRRRAPPPLPPRADSMPSMSTCRWRRPRRRWSPTTWSGSASPTRESSPTAAPTATCSACSRCTASGSAPRTSPSPLSTAASCSTTCSPTCPPRRVEPELGASL